MVIAAQILEELGYDPLQLLRPLFFPAGNMFWGAIDSFMPLVPYFVDQGRYPVEPVALDGTFLHAVERCYTFVLGSVGLGVGFLFPPQIGALSSGLRGVWFEPPMDGKESSANTDQLTETLRLHQLYTTPTKEWCDRAQRGERELTALKEVVNSIQSSRWSRLKTRWIRLMNNG
jgi:hypothetical protein